MTPDHQAMSFEEMDRIVAEAKTMPGTQRGAYYNGLPDSFFAGLYARYLAIGRIHNATGIATATLRTQLGRRGISYCHSMHRIDCRPELEPIFDGCTTLCPRIEDNRIPADKDYLIVTCLHVPTISKLWTLRSLSAADTEKCEGLIIVGDLVNADAIGRFAEKERGIMVRFQDELNLARPLLAALGKRFNPIYILAGNHEMRLIYRMEHEVDSDDHFESLFRHGKWYEGTELLLGDRIVLAHGRGRKVLSSAQNEYSLVAEKDYFLAGPHRFMAGYSQSGRRIGMLGGLFDAEALRYYVESIKINRYINGFWIYKRPGIMLPFADGFVNWSDYGCE